GAARRPPRGRIARRKTACVALPYVQRTHLERMRSPMSRRLSIVLLVTAATLAFALPGGARTAQNTLNGTVGPGFTIRLTDESGALVSHLDPGTYTINVKDQADIHNFDLHGPGVS